MFNQKRGEDLPSGEKIRGISQSVFFSCADLKRVELEEGSQIIGQNAFHGCKNLQEIVLPRSFIDLPVMAVSNSGVNKRSGGTGVVKFVGRTKEEVERDFKYSLFLGVINWEAVPERNVSEGKFEFRVHETKSVRNGKFQFFSESDLVSDGMGDGTARA